MFNRDGDVEGDKRWYDPSLHCDNKCARLGYRRFSCGSARWIDKEAYEKNGKVKDVVRSDVISSVQG